jgi:hypothetical protein
MGVRDTTAVVPPGAARQELADALNAATVLVY